MELEGKPFWEEAPTLPEDLEDIYNIFWNLSDSRPPGSFGGVGLIPFLVVDQYAARFDIEDFEEFWYYIRGLDREYLKFLSDRKGGR